MTMTMETAVQDNQGLAIKEANKFRYMGVPMDDLLQEANIGLMLASQVFDSAKGAWSTIATIHIRKQLFLAVKGEHKLHIPMPVFAAMSAIRKARAALTTNAVEPTDAVVTDHIVASGKFTNAQIVQGFDAIRAAACGSLDVAVNDDGDTLADSVLASSETVSEDIEALLDKLDAQSRKILELRFGLGCEAQTLQQVGDKIGLTKERVRQIQAKAIKSLA